jgi:secreted Zn-dependent insulinase-like peptidase
MKIIKSKNDNKDYLYETLSNKIKTLCISDMKQNETFVCLTIDIGSYSDPKEYCGMAHYLEHMILTGSTKYPKPNMFSEYINKYGGYFNAHTSNTFTSYYFKIQTEYVKKALSIFSSFFVYPLFNKDIYKSEIESVDAEHKKNLVSPNFLITDMLKYLVNPEHPYSKFSTGNKKILDKKEIYEELINFYNATYSSNLMKLTILSNLQTDVILNLATKYFKKIKNKNIEEIDIQVPILNQHGIIKVKSPLELTTFAWEIPETKYKTIIAEYIVNIISYKGKNSFSYFFNSLNLFIGDIKAYYDNPNILIISVSVTESGFYFIPSIVRAMKQYLKLIFKEGCDEWRYTEICDNILNKFDSKFDLIMDNICNITETIGRQEISEILTLMYSYPKYEVIKNDLIECAKILYKTNPKIIILSDSFSKDEFTKFDQNYNVNYSISDDFNDYFNDVDVGFRYSLPLPNENILKSISKNVYKKVLRFPKLLVEDNRAKLFYKNYVDDNFPIKIVVIYENTFIEYSAMQQTIVLIFLTVIDIRLDLIANQLENSGITMSIMKSLDKLNFSISSYKENMDYAISSFHNIFSKKISNLEMSMAINIIRNRVKATADKKKSEKSFVNKCIVNEMYPVIFSNKGVENIIFGKIDKISDEIKSILYDNTKLLCLIYGNCLPDDAKKYFKEFIKYLNPTKDSSSLILKNISGDINYTFSGVNPNANNNVYARLYYCIKYNKLNETALSIKQIILSKIVSMIMNRNFSYYMRNEYSLGYINYMSDISYDTFSEKAVMVYFYVQSPDHNPKAIKSYVEKYLKIQLDELKKLKEISLSKYKETMIDQYNNIFVKPSTQIEYYLDCIIDGVDFDYSKIIEIIKQIKVTDIVEFYEKTFVDKENPKVSYEYHK